MRIIALILWLLFWSLGSVLLIRLSEKVDKETIKWILRWRSKCPHCRATLKARNLIPLLSFLIQRGRCDQCKQAISRLYPVLEIGSAIIFLVSFFAFQNMGIGTIVFWCGVNWLLFLLIAYDVMRYELHVPLRIILTIGLIAGSVFGLWWTITQALASFGFFAVGYCIIFLWAKRYAKVRYGASEWFGEWDLYLWAALGLWLPFILQYNFIARWRSGLVNVFLLFIILSSIIWIILWIILKIIVRKFPTLMTNNVSPLFQQKLLLPFIPAMILAFWLLLRKADFFISLLFPLW